MHLIVGLGNPEEEYSRTRHNMGFNTVNAIARKFNIEVSKKKFDGLYGSGEIYGEKVILLKPQTYMNLSGKSIRQCIEFYKIDISDIIVIYDDLDIDVGKIKIRKKGGSGTHNGMKSVVNELHSEDFCRIRIGIGLPKYKTDLVNYVIGHISDEEYNEFCKIAETASDAVCEIVRSGIDASMNKFN